jgi:hypothetical protein
MELTKDRLTPEIVAQGLESELERKLDADYTSMKIRVVPMA